MPAGELDSATMRFIEQFGSYFAGFGLNRTMGQMWAWLLVADPPEQSTSDIMEALHVSKGSVSTTGRALAAMGVIERFHKRGSREWHFRAVAEAFSGLMKAKVREYTVMREMLERAISDLGPGHSRVDNLEEMHRIFSFYEERVPAIIDEYLEGKQKGAAR